MPWSGGSFTRTNGVNTGSTLWAQDRDEGYKILASHHDTHDQDIADGVNSTLEKSGSNAATGNLDIGSNRITTMADGTAKQDAATLNQIVSNGPAYAADSGTADTAVVTLSPAITAYAAGQRITFKANAASTGAATVNVNTLGAKTLKKHNDQDIAAGDIESGSIVTAVYDGTNFQVTSQLATSGGSPLVPSSLTDGGVLLGSGTGEITAMAVLTDSQMIVGNGSTDPVAESGATLRASIGVGTSDTPTFAGINLGDENMDDYDEGTWTPSIASETGSISAFTLREGVYVRIGEWVNCTGTIDVNTVSTPGGNLTFSGIPFTLPNDDGNQGAFVCNANGWSGLGTASMHGVQTKNATTGIIGKAGDSGSINDVAGDLQNGCGLHFTLGFSLV